VNLDGRDFPGRDAIAAIAERGPTQRRVGLQLEGRRVPREEYSVVADDNQIGRVTSGTFSPTLQKPIAMAYVDRDHVEFGREVAVDIRGRLASATIVKLPFYKR
jgi:aminomethyltransferase